jgi:hypothetical protein
MWRVRSAALERDALGRLPHKGCPWAGRSRHIQDRELSTPTYWRSAERCRLSRRVTRASAPTIGRSVRAFDRSSARSPRYQGPSDTRACRVFYRRPILGYRRVRRAQLLDVARDNKPKTWEHLVANRSIADVRVAVLGKLLCVDVAVVAVRGTLRRFWTSACLSVRTPLDEAHPRCRTGRAAAKCRPLVQRGVRGRCPKPTGHAANVTASSAGSIILICRSMLTSAAGMNAPVMTDRQT